MQKRITVRFQGRVQGVGFRWETCHMARHRDLTGWVKNLPDGSVHLVAEGREEDLQDLLDSIASSRLGTGVDRQDLAWGPAQQAFTEFGIAR